MLERKLTWNDIWKAEPQHIKFIVQAVYVLPSPANLHVCGVLKSLRRGFLFSITPFGDQFVLMHCLFLFIELLIRVPFACHTTETFSY